MKKVKIKKAKLAKKIDPKIKKSNDKSCKEFDRIMKELEDDFYQTQVLGIPLK